MDRCRGSSCRILSGERRYQGTQGWIGVGNLIGNNSTPLVLPRDDGILELVIYPADRIADFKFKVFLSISAICGSFASLQYGEYEIRYVADYRSSRFGRIGTSCSKESNAMIGSKESLKMIMSRVEVCLRAASCF